MFSVSLTLSDMLGWLPAMSPKAHFIPCARLSTNEPPPKARDVLRPGGPFSRAYHYPLALRRALILHFSPGIRRRLCYNHLAGLLGLGAPSEAAFKPPQEGRGALF